MTVSIEFSTDARAEFDKAFDWYAERSAGAAIGFATEIDVAIESILADPTRFVRTYAGCQLCRVKRFPFCVVYHHIGDKITVVAIAHAKRRPGYWYTRL
ncbi:MAG TPA: type II toxin-antitoxin system RelE/ParE family toxin [Pirellulaceae bacterium]|nr:type II toxin-antitoxin system RelE/ParE family toxin [Pirellulaceae bacterium]HMO93850.1 type II toxin-antitoxin system RelE/ParE family toxin [Pirellulaceae bacterium]HMP71146.1 type II toxin-antitoxin system RelE/ParE family toxin [Pirellulaceae bacterium]